MKNWELEQYLRAVQSDYDYGRDKTATFRRSYDGKEDDYVIVSYYGAINQSIEYIEKLESKVEELLYAQMIIDEVKRQNKQQASDIKTVKHSKWVGFPNNGAWDLKCDNCHRIIPFGQTPETMHYCPLCGSKMDGDKNDGCN